MSSLTIRLDTRDLMRALDNARRQISFATMVAVNDLAFRVREAENAAMTTMFKHPRLFTQRAVVGRDIRRATKDNPTAPRHAFLSPETSAQTGRIRAFNYQGAIMDAVTDPLAEKITAKKSTRVGYTKILDNIGKQKLLKRVFGNGSSITFVGANSPGGFRRIAGRIVLFDEVDDYPGRWRGLGRRR